MDNGLALVAGAGGFLGGHLVAALRASGLRVRAVDRRPLAGWSQCFDDVESARLDLLDRRACGEACRGATEVYDLTGGAATSAGEPAPLRLPVGAALLGAARARGVRRLLIAVPAGRPAADDPHGPLLASLSQQFGAESGVPTAIARCVDVYGPHAAFEGEWAGEPASVCRRVQEAIESGGRGLAPVDDDGEQRTWLYVDDCIAGLRALMRGDLELVADLAGAESATAAGLAELVAQVAGTERAPLLERMAVDRERGGGVALALPDWRPVVSLRAGLRRTYDWIARCRGHRPGTREARVVLPVARRVVAASAAPSIRRSTAARAR